MDFQENYPGVLDEKNIDNILNERIKQAPRASLLAKLNKKRKSEKETEQSQKKKSRNDREER